MTTASLQTDASSVPTSSEVSSEAARGTTERTSADLKHSDDLEHSADLERSLTRVARSMLRLQVPPEVLPAGITLNRSGHWVLARLSEQSPARLSDIAESLGLDISTVSRQVRDLVMADLMTKVPDPADGRASLLSLTPRGEAVLRAVSESRRDALAVAVAGWTDDERAALAAGLVRLGADLVDLSARPGVTTLLPPPAPHGPTDEVRR